MGKIRKTGSIAFVVGILFALLTGLAGARVTITFWHFLAAGTELDALNVMKAEFEKSHPDISVSMQYTPWGETYYSKFLVAVVGGTPPDVAMMHATKIAEFVEANTLFELTATELESAGIQGEDYFPIPWKASQYRGKVYALPFDIHPIGLYFNPSLFDRAAIDPKAPEKADQLFEYARKLNRDTNGDGRVDQHGLGIRPDSFTYYRIWYSLVEQFNGSLLTEDSHNMSADVAQSKALNVLIDAVKNNLISLEWIDTAFPQEKLAMCIDGTWYMGGFMKSGVDFEAAPLPVFGTKPAAWTDSHLIVLPKPQRLNREKLDAAKTFAKWMTQNNYTWCKMAGHVSPSRKVLLSPEFRKLRYQVQFARMLPYVVYFPQVVRSWELQNLIANSLVPAFGLKQSPENVLEGLRTQVNALLSSKKK